MCCIYSTNTNTHTSTLTGQTWPMKQSITCEDSRAFYSITSFHEAGQQCLRKQAQYGGKVGGKGPRSQGTRPCQVRCRHRAAVEHHFRHRGGGVFQPAWPRPGRFQLPTIRENPKQRSLRPREQRMFVGPYVPMWISCVFTVAA